MNFKKLKMILFFLVPVVLVFVVVFLIIFYNPVEKITPKSQETELETIKISTNHKSDEMNPVYKKVKQSILKQLTFLQIQGYNLETLEVSNFYPQKLENSSFSFQGNKGDKIKNHCLQVSYLIGKKSGSTLDMSLYLCMSELEAKSLSQYRKEDGQALILEDNLVLSFSYREKFNAINKEEEVKLFDRLKNSWVALKETNWPSLDNFNPFDVYAFISGYYFTDYIDSVTFIFDKNINKNNFFLNLGLEEFLEGSVIVNEIGFKNKEEVKNFVQAKTASAVLDQENNLEDGLKEYFFIKRYITNYETNQIYDIGQDRRDKLVCDFKVAYHYDDLLFEFLGRKKEMGLEGLNYSQGIEGLTCFTESEIDEILREARLAIKLFLLPLKNKEAKILNQAYSYNGDDYYLFDPRLKITTNLSVNCVEDDDCKLIEHDYNNYLVFSVSRDNEKKLINDFITIIDNFAQRFNLKKANKQVINYQPICDAGVCGFDLKN